MSKLRCWAYTFTIIGSGVFLAWAVHEIRIHI